MHDRPVALVTGGSRGIGRAICQTLAERTYTVVVNYANNLAAAEETCQLIGGGSWSVQADVARQTDRERMVDEVMARLGRIDLLVNNAGITSVGRKDLLEATEESWETVLGTNLKGPFFLSQRVANEMIRIGPEKLVRPAIINISSLSATTVSVNRGDYCISKAGMVMLTKLFATRLAPHAIRVFEVRPGIIDTDMTAGVRDRYIQRIEEGLTPIRRLGTAEEVGAAVACLATADLPFSTGDTLNVDGGFHLRSL